MSLWLFRSSAGAAYVAVLCGGLVLSTVSGCGSTRAKDVDVELARQTLVKVLNHWKDGGQIDDFRNARPEIVVQERLWSDGKQLLKYALIDSGRAEDANWYCEVELTLEGDATENSYSIVKKVTYVVGTDPVLTVFHAIL